MLLCSGFVLWPSNTRAETVLELTLRHEVRMSKFTPIVFLIRCVNRSVKIMFVTRLVEVMNVLYSGAHRLCDRAIKSFDLALFRSILTRYRLPPIS